jgi:ClpP class serine protease
MAGNILKAFGLARRTSAPAAPVRPTLFEDSREPPPKEEAPAVCWEESIARLQASRGSHVIAIVHGHPLPSDDPWDWYFRELIGPRHLEDFLTAMHGVPPTARLDIVLHSFGGLFGAVQQIARAIKAHRGETTVFVPHHAQQLSSLIALAGKKLVMGPNAVLSFIEPFDQTLEKVLRQKGARRVSDFTVMRLHMERCWSRETRAFICELAHGGVHGASCRLAQEIAGGAQLPWTPMTVALARKVGLAPSTDMPSEVFEIIRASRACPTGDHGIKTRPEPHDEPALLRASGGVQTVWRAHAGLRPWPSEFEPWKPRYDGNRPRAPSSPPASGDNCPLAARPFIARMEAARGSRVLCIVHQMNMESFHVDLVTAEDVVSALSTIDPNVPLDLILHTPGGSGFEGEQIARAIKAHKGRKTVFVPVFAMSAGTIISLAADEIVMSEHASLGPIDAQFGHVPTRAILSVLETKPRKKITDGVLAIGLLCQRNVKADHARALELMAGTYAPSVANRIAHRLNDGDLSHGYPLTYAEARGLGLRVSNAMPGEPIEIVRAFRREKDGGRSVLFCS